MQSQRIAIALGTLVLIIAAGLLPPPVGFGPGEESAEATLLSEVTKLLASDAQAEDGFGGSVAVSGDTAIVGACCQDAGAANAGAAYVFRRDEGGAGSWGEVTKLTASDGQANDLFGRTVAISGDTAVVGAFFEDAAASDAGAAYVFQRDQGGADNWGEVAKLTASDAEGRDRFGGSVAVNGDTAVVGAVGEDEEDSNAGAAYVFGRDEGGAGNWGEVTKLTASDADPGDFFGGSVAVSGDTAVVGAVFEGSAGHNAGAAYVFARDEGGPNNWGEVTKLTASDTQGLDHFGRSVALNGDTAVVGAAGEDAAGIDAGAAYVFGRDEGGAGNWGEVIKLTASDAQADDAFGGTVTVSGDTAVVGAPAEDPGGCDAGAAYVFGRDEGGAGSWGEVKKLTAPDAEAGDFFGSVTVSGDTAVVGAVREDAAGSNAGAAYVFDLLLSKSTPATDACPQGMMEVDCDTSAAGVQSDCTHAPGASFPVEIHVTEAPTVGYGHFQVKLEWTEGVIDYLPTVDAADEALWGPCTIASRLNNWEQSGEPSVFFSCNAFPALSTGDTTTGAVLTFEMQCRSAKEALSPPAGLGSDQSVLHLVPVPDTQGGTRFGDVANQPVTPALADATVTCAEPAQQPSGTDSDGDGCTDAHERGPNPALGGQRDATSFWDFFDVPVAGSPRDRTVDAFDIGAVVLRFGTFVQQPPTTEEAFAQALTLPPDMTSYHAAFDRTLLGPAPWNLGPPDGSIDASDIGAVVVQFGHACA